MKTYFGFCTFAFAMLLFFGAARSYAEKMDAEVHTIVIDKLENVLSKAKDDETLSLKPIRARLADLYSERARLRAMKEAEENCPSPKQDFDCEGSKKDRARAIELYNTVVVEAAPSDQGTLLMHKAHLHELQFEDKKAFAIYDKLIVRGPKVYGSDILADAHLRRGEILYSRGEFKKAKSDFSDSIRLSPVQLQGYATFRLAWCELNLGFQQKAVGIMTKLLRSPQMLKQAGERNGSIDSSFQEDVSRDLASFIARGPISETEIRSLVELSPATAQRDNVRYLATECERLGSPSSALLAWDAFISPNLGVAGMKSTPASDDDRLEAMIHVAMIRLQMNRKQEAVSSLEKAGKQFREIGCHREAAECETLKQKFRKVTVDWHRAEKKKPSKELLASYENYINTFPDDLEMMIWGAELARELKKNAESYSYFARVAESSGGAAKSDDKAKDQSEIRERAMVACIELAEEMKSTNLREESYLRYLRLHPNGPKSIEVQYQLARLPYESGKNAEASNKFFAFSTSADCRKLEAQSASIDDAGLCEKSADLDFDALASLHQDALIETHAKVLAEIYPKRRVEYLGYARKAAINQVAVSSRNAQNGDSATLKAAQDKLKSVSLVGASQEEKISYWKNRIQLGEKAREMTEVIVASTGLLGLKALSSADTEYALERKEWAYEMQLDFVNAYAVARKMQMPRLRPEEKQLKLALLAELAGLSPLVYEQNYLQLSRSSKSARAVRAKMILASRSPVVEMRKWDRELSADPEVYAPLSLEIYARTQDLSFARHAIAVRGVSSQPAGRVLGRYLFEHDFAELQNRLASAHLQKNTSSSLAKSLTLRVQLLKEVDAFADRALHASDWALEIATLTTLAHENGRLYRDIMSLPAPRGLPVRSRAKYQQLLTQKAAVYKNKQDLIERELARYSQDETALANAAHAAERTSKVLKPLVAQDIRLLARSSPPVAGRFRTALQSEERELDRQVETAKSGVIHNPFAEDSLMQLRDLEERCGRETMVTYLDGRIQKLHGQNTRVEQ